MKEVANGLGYERVDGILLDIGVSTMHLKSGDRGFSFMLDGPLDMRMDQSQGMTAADIVNSYKEKDLADLIYGYGEERFSRRIAKSIVNSRSKKPFERSGELALLIEKTVGRRGKIHPATRTFQAIRIAVNRELESLNTVMDKCVAPLRNGARVCVISFHSLEDRIVKEKFRSFVQEGKIKLVVKKPLRPDEKEVDQNPRSRSARLRIAEKIK